MELSRREYNNLKELSKNTGKKEFKKLVKRAKNNKVKINITRTVFVDMDNTIAENITCKDIQYYKGLYLYKRPIRIVIDAIEYLYSRSEIVIISKALGGNSGRLEKLKWIEKNMSLPKNTKCIFLTEQEPATKKADIIKEYCKKNHIDIKDVLLIDDNKKILQACDKKGIPVKYPQQVICDYQEQNSYY